MDVIYYFPKRFFNFISLLLKRIEDLDPAKIPTCLRTGICMLTRRKNGKGEEVPHLLPVRLNQPYVKPQLTELGRLLLGMDKWPSESSSSSRCCCDAANDNKRQKLN